MSCLKILHRSLIIVRKNCFRVDFFILLYLISLFYQIKTERNNVLTDFCASDANIITISVL